MFNEIYFWKPIIGHGGSCQYFNQAVVAWVDRYRQYWKHTLYCYKEYKLPTFDNIYRIQLINKDYAYNALEHPIYTKRTGKVVTDFLSAFVQKWDKIQLNMQ